MTFFTILLLIVLALVLPLMGIRDIRRLRRRLAAGDPDARSSTYRQTLVQLWGLAMLFGAGWFLAGGDAGSAYLIPAATGWQRAAVALGAVGVAVLLIQMRAVLGDPDGLADLRGKIGDLKDFSPQTDAELRLFSFVSVTAGICEEILYRGLLLGAFVPLTGTWGALALSTIVFGLGHAYQGAAGAVKSVVVGLVLGLLTVFSGSLFTAVVLHAVIDLTSGRMMREALRDA
jgi:membrane protease YdiL (CAAX protease family)